MSDLPMQSAENYLQKNRRFVLNDLASFTGIAVFDAKNLLDDLLKKYECRLQVTEQGEIIYDFGELLRRGEKTWEERKEELLNQAWEIFKLAFRIWIAVTLVVYFVFFFVILIAIIIAQIAAMFSSDGDSDSDFGIGDAIGGVFRLFLEIFYWNTVLSSTHYHTDANGYTYQEYDARPHTMSNKKGGKNFVSSVYDYVFGTPRVPIDELGNQKEIASYIQKNGGIITPTEVKLLNGLGASEADKLFSDVLVRFEGTPEVTEEGVLYADFENFLTRTQNSETPVVYYWDEFEPEHKLTGNTTGRNTLISFLNGFNLIFAFLGVSGFFNVLFGMDKATWLVWLLGYMPVLFSIIFFSVPILRSFSLSAKNEKRKASNKRKRLIRVLYEANGKNLSLDDIEKSVNAQNIQEKLSSSEIEKMMKEIALDFDAEGVVNEKTGTFEYSFKNMNMDLAASRKLKQKRGKNIGNVGNVIFDSKDN